jgi:hypothetical protein
MKFGKYLETKQKPEWKVDPSLEVLSTPYKSCHGPPTLMVGIEHVLNLHVCCHRRRVSQDHYVDYSGLKDLIKAQADQGSSGQAAYSPRTTSLTVQRYNNKSNTNEEAFFKKLEADVRLTGDS